MTHRSFNHKKLKLRVHKRDKFICRYCLRDMSWEWEQYMKGLMTRTRCPVSVDHVIPVSKGGEWTLENLVTACKPCNYQKKDIYI